VSTDTKQETCKERIAYQMASREEEIGRLLTLCDGDSGADEQEEAQTELDQLPLSVDTKQVTTITLSWGGPADYLEVKHQERDIIGITYRYSDWFDTATRVVTIDSPLYDYAVSVIEGLNS